MKAEFYEFSCCLDETESVRNASEEGNPDSFLRLLSRLRAENVRYRRKRWQALRELPVYARCRSRLRIANKESQ